jgi:hypothetical protein
MSKERRVVDVDCYLLAITDKAIKVTLKEKDEHTEDDGVWLPLSIVDYESTGMRTVCVTMPEWKAIDTGLV